MAINKIKLAALARYLQCLDPGAKKFMEINKIELLDIIFVLHKDDIDDIYEIVRKQKQ